VAIAVALLGGRSRVTRLAEAGSARIRLPRTADGSLEAVTVNTGGGVAGGDRFANIVEVGHGAALVVTTAAAEKIYGSDGPEATIATTIRVEEGGTVEWLPQETILFDRARLRRTLAVDLAADARALLFEATVFGRKARGETVETGAFRERWRVRRAGRLVYADDLRLGGDVADLLARPSVANGARALATLLYVGPDAETRIEEARAALEGATSECGASAWNGLLAIRFLAQDAETLRRDAARFMRAWRGRDLPRNWHL
jgi:urease accessory protein